jgi:hypothetical protein
VAVNTAQISRILYFADGHHCPLMVENETGFSHPLLTPFHRCLAEAIRLHHPDEPEGDTMDTR